MSPIFEALTLLTPYDVDTPKMRVGPNTDGGYVMVDNISPDQTVMSYGISTEYRFDEEMAVRGHKVFMFDHTIGEISARHANMMWFPEGVAAHTDADKSLYSIEAHLQKYAIDGDRLLLKMDVEGAEFEVLSATNDATLARFDQILLEVHCLNALEQEAFRDLFVAMLTKLNRQFTLCHVHANNCDGPNGISIAGGFPVSSLMELTYVRTASVKRFPSRTLYPTALDYPCTANREKLLWFFPFAPSSIALDEFATCENRVSLMDKTRVNEA